jgi:hypothetical protein
MEKRKSFRIDYELEIEVWGRRGPNKIANLSTRGVFIYSAKPSQFKPGDEIDIVLNFPFEEEAMKIKAQVVRVTDLGIGVEFMNLGFGHIRALERCIRSEYLETYSSVSSVVNRTSSRLQTASRLKK